MEKPSRNAQENGRDDDDDDTEYFTAPIRAPVFSGFLLKLFTWILENKVIGLLALNHLKKNNLITKFFTKTQYNEPPMNIPRFPIKALEEPYVIQLNPVLSPIKRLESVLECLASSSSSSPLSSSGASEGFHHWTILDYYSAYTSQKTTPSKVVVNFLNAFKASHEPAPGMGFFISCYEEDVIKQGELSTARYQKGEPLSILDGVLIAVKDEIDCLPYPTSGGSKWLPHTRKVKEDAECVKHLRDCGAILVGKTNMHELGSGISGINPHYGASRNPYDKSRFSGGSSGGSAAVVAAGLCPVALGVDGGGSVRIPSALCGIIGLKGTFGRVSSNGVLPFNWSLGAVGIHATTVEDALIMYTVIHGLGSNENVYSTPPPANIPRLTRIPESENLISNIKFAKYTKWFEDCDGPVYKACLNALKELQNCYNCKVVEVTIPEIEQMRRAHYITIGSEMITSLGIDYTKWGKEVSGMDTRAGLAMYACFTGREYIAAQKMRYRQMLRHMEIFKKADIIVTPSTGATAKHVTKKATDVGELDYVLGGKLTNYQIGANLLGFPAITIPVGYDDEGMPIGIQFMGPPWSEATLLRIAFALEKLVMAKMTQPQVYYNMLQDVC